MRRALAGLLMGLLAAALPAGAATLAGPARSLDGDTLEIAGQRVRLFGIDAPEAGQRCADAAGRAYRCGERAAEALAAMIAGRTVRCETSGSDPYGRLVARCAADGADIARRMVLAGHALAFVKFTDLYAADEALARTAGRGLWAGRFEPPWDWRAARWADAAGIAPRAGCPIKGNITRAGDRIYHLPGGRD
jgi:endonuclease YncB( thermonuclease family)